MNIQDSKAIVPVQKSMSLYAYNQHKEPDSFKRQNVPGDEMVFIGYGTGYNDNSYTHLGKIKDNSVNLGELIDIYV